MILLLQIRDAEVFASRPIALLLGALAITIVVAAIVIGIRTLRR